MRPRGWTAWRWPPTPMLSVGRPVPRVSYRVLHILPRTLTAVFVPIPPTAEIGLDIVPLTSPVPVRRFEPVAIPRAVVVEAAIRGRVWTSAPRISPERLFGSPVELIPRRAEPLRWVYVPVWHDRSW